MHDRKFSFYVHAPPTQEVPINILLPVPGLTSCLNSSLCTTGEVLVLEEVTLGTVLSSIGSKGNMYLEEGGLPVISSEKSSSSDRLFRPPGVMLSRYLAVMLLVSRKSCDNSTTPGTASMQQMRFAPFTRKRCVSLLC